MTLESGRKKNSTKQQNKLETVEEVGRQREDGVLYHFNILFYHTTTVGDGGLLLPKERSLCQLQQSSCGVHPGNQNKYGVLQLESSTTYDQ